MDTIPIAHLEQRDISATTKSIRGIVTLIWPYSSSTQRAAILVAEPDFRLRKSKGQVRVQLAGVTAQEVAKSKISSGDEVVLSLAGARWVAAAAGISTPGRSVDIELEYKRRLVCEIYRNGTLHSKLDINDQSLSEPRSSHGSPDTPFRTSRPLSTPYLGRINGLSTPASSAFHRRARVVSGELVDSPYDPFVSDQKAVSHARKKQRMSWGGDSRWTINDNVPSPSKRNARDDWIRDEDLQSPRKRKGKEPVVLASPSPVERESPSPVEQDLPILPDVMELETEVGKDQYTQDLVDMVSGDTEEEDFSELVDLGGHSRAEELQLEEESAEALLNPFAGPGVFGGKMKFSVFKDFSAEDPLAVSTGSLFSRPEVKQAPQNVVHGEDEILNIPTSSPPVAKEPEPVFEPSTPTQLPESEYSSHPAETAARSKRKSPEVHVRGIEHDDEEEATRSLEHQGSRRLPTSSPPVAEPENKPRTPKRLLQIEDLPSPKFTEAGSKSSPPKIGALAAEQVDEEDPIKSPQHKRQRPRTPRMQITNMPPPLLLPTLQTTNFSTAFTARPPQSALPSSPKTPDIRPQHSAALPLPSPFPGEELSSYMETTPAALRSSFIAPSVSSSSPVMPDWMLQFGFGFGSQGFLRSPEKSPPKESTEKTRDEIVLQEEEVHQSDGSVEESDEKDSKQDINMDVEEDDLYKMPTPTRSRRRTPVVSGLADRNEAAENLAEEATSIQNDVEEPSPSLPKLTTPDDAQSDGAATDILAEDDKEGSLEAEATPILAAQSAPMVPESVTRALAMRASEDSKLREVMRLVADNEATTVQLHYFQQHIDELTAATSTPFLGPDEDQISALDPQLETAVITADSPTHSSTEFDDAVDNALAGGVNPEIKPHIEGKEVETREVEEGEEFSGFDEADESEDSADESDEEESEAEFASVYRGIQQQAERSSSVAFEESEGAEKEVSKIDNDVITTNIRPPTPLETASQKREPVIIDLLDSDTEESEDDEEITSGNHDRIEPVSEAREPPPLSPITPRKAQLSFEAQHLMDEMTTPHNDAKYAPSTSEPPTSSPMPKQESQYQPSVPMPTRSGVSFGPRVTRRRAAANAESAAEYEPQSSIPLANSQRHTLPSRLSVQDTFEGREHSDGSLTTAPPSRGSDTSRATSRMDEVAEEDETGMSPLVARSLNEEPVLDIQSYDGVYDGVVVDFIASSPPAAHDSVLYPDIPPFEDNPLFVNESFRAQNTFHESRLPATPDQSQLYSQQSAASALSRAAQQESHLPTPHQTQQFEQSLGSVYQDAQVPIVSDISGQITSEVPEMKASSSPAKDQSYIGSSALAPYFSARSSKKNGLMKHEVKETDVEDSLFMPGDDSYGPEHGIEEPEVEDSLAIHANDGFGNGHRQDRSVRAELSSYKPSSPAPPRTQPITSQVEIPEFSFTQSQATSVQGVATSLSYYIALPNLYSHIRVPSQTYYDGCVDVIAIVHEPSLEPKKAEKGQRDWFTSLRITDENFYTTAAKKSIYVQIFRPWRAALPQAKEGDVILLRGFEVSSAKGKIGIQLKSAESAAWCVWRFGVEELDMTGSSDDRPAWARREERSVEEMKGPPVELGDGEREYVGKLRKWWVDLQRPKSPASQAANL